MGSCRVGDGGVVVGAVREGVHRRVAQTAAAMGLGILVTLLHDRARNR